VRTVTVTSSIPGQGISPEQFSPEQFTPEEFSPERLTSERHQAVDIDEATRQLELAAHDVAVASRCIALGDLDRAHTSVITARAEVDAAENILRVALNLADLSQA
jgi:hypothetical protein